MTETISLTGNHFAIARSFRKITRMDKAGLITDVKKTRIGFMNWHLEFKVEIKS